MRLARPGIRLFVGCAALAIAVSFASRGDAHQLDVTTARVVLRDGHTEIVAEIDVLGLLLQTGSAPHDAAADATALATASEDVLASRVAVARAVVEQGARLDVDGVSIPLALRAFPTPKEVRFLAARLSADPSAHGAASTLRLESTRVVPEARSIAVKMAPELGSVLFSFVQPATRLGAPGAAAAFTVLEAPRVATAASPPPSSRRSWLALGAGALAVVAVAARLRGRRWAPDRSIDDSRVV